MRIALDTNVLAYAEGAGDENRCRRARELVRQLDPSSVVLVSQTLGELFMVLVRKLKTDPDTARQAILSWMDAYELTESNSTALLSAMDLACDHQLQIWDALILASAAEARCRFLLSEDMHDGFTWRGVTVVNPFVSTLPEKIGVLLRRP